MNSCRDVVDLITDYLDDDLDSETKKQFDLHIEGCVDCTAFLNTFKKSSDILKKIPCENIPDELLLKIKTLVKRGKEDK